MKNFKNIAIESRLYTTWKDSIQKELVRMSRIFMIYTYDERKHHEIY